MKWKKKLRPCIEKLIIFALESSYIELGFFYFGFPPNKSIGSTGY